MDVLTDAAPTDGRTWRGIQNLGPDALKAFEELLPYCFPEGERWQYRYEGSPVVRYTVADGTRATQIEHRLDRAMGRAAGTPSRPPRVLFEQAGPTVTEVPAADLRAVGPGLVVLGPAPARLAAIVDRFAQELAHSLGAVEYTVPHLVSWETIDRAGYARTFPQHLTACSVVAPDLSALDRFAAADNLVDRDADLRPAPVTLAPTVCMNIFAAHADRPLSGPVTATAKQACARHEVIAEGATRLWSFNMREIVYIGEADGAREFCRDIIGELIDLLRSIGLPATICSASDPFFTVERESLSSYQSRLDLKQEVRGRMAGDDREVAITSVNIHNQHFGQSFGISLSDDASSSACVGFGLERWAQWLHGYVGDDAQRWPKALRRLDAGW